jgi:hypothetical protein
LLLCDEFEATYFEPVWDTSWRTYLHYFLDYAATHWDLHVREARFGCDDDGGRLSILALSSQLCMPGTWRYQVWTERKNMPSLKCRCESFAPDTVTLKATVAAGITPLARAMLCKHKAAGAGCYDMRALNCILNRATHYGHDDVVGLLLEHGATDEDGHALATAFEKGHPSLVELILPTSLVSKWTVHRALTQAATHGRLETVRYPVNGAGAKPDIEILTQACASLRTLVVRYLLTQMGTNLDLMAAIPGDPRPDISVGDLWNRSRVDIFTLLLEQGARVQSDVDMEKAIQSLVSSGECQVLRAFLDAHGSLAEPPLIDPPRRWDHQLHYAAKSGSLEMIQFLVDRGADLHAAGRGPNGDPLLLSIVMHCPDSEKSAQYIARLQDDVDLLGPRASLPWQERRNIRASKCCGSLFTMAPMSTCGTILVRRP